MANMIDTIYTMWLREIKRYLKSKSRVIGSGGQPLIWLAIFGVGFSSAVAIVGVSNYLTFMAPGIMGMTLLFTSIFSGINVIWDKQFGFLKEILVAPVSRIGIVLGKIAGSTTVALINALFILILVVLFGVITLSSLSVIGVAVAIAFMIMISAVFVGIGLIIGSTINNVEGFQVIVNFLVMPLFFISGALFPITKNAPLWMRLISYIDPLSYGIDGLRGALIGMHSYPIYVDGLVTLAFAVAFILIAQECFKRMQAK
jgi:ABC-2 type transport system permease protein